jgi:hypothetical protein
MAGDGEPGELFFRCIMRPCLERVAPACVGRAADISGSVARWDAAHGWQSRSQGRLRERDSSCPDR